MTDSIRAPSPLWALTALSLAMLLSTLSISIANVALPTLATAFAASFQTVQWIVIAYLLVITTLVVSVGRLGDLIGRRRLLVAGLIVFTFASILCAVAPSVWVLIGARAVQGLGAATMMALTMAFVGAILPKDRTGSAMGLLGTMSAVGTALGPSLGGLLIAAFDWRVIFLINAPLGALAALAAWRALPADDASSARQAGFDLVGTLLLALTLAAYALAMTVGDGKAVLLVAAVVGAGLFVRTEALAASPLIRLAMFRDATLSAGLITSALVSTVLMATLVVGPFYLSSALGLDAAMVGLVVSIGPIVAALTGVPAGRIADRFGAERVAAFGLIGVAAGCVGLSASSGVAGYIAPLIVVTASYALFQTANNTVVMKDVLADRRGVVSGVLTLSRNLGLVSGASVMGAVFAAGGMRLTFAVAAVLIGVALAVAVGSRAVAGQSRA